VDARVTLPAAHTAGSPRHLTIPAPELAVALLGREDVTLRAVERMLPGADIHVRGEQITVLGDGADADLAVRLLAELIDVVARGGHVGVDDARRVLAMLRSEARDGQVPGPATPPKGTRPADILTHSILTTRGKSVRPKTVGQKRYVDAIDTHTVTFGIGPAGTGKTYLAMAKAVQALQSKQVNRIVLTRPAVEAGERLGFLPGTLNEKIDPYLRPLYDALQDMVDPESIPRLMEAGTIEVAPLAYMRGRTLNDAFIILDEAQNTSPEQMKMFLTRLGFGATMVVTGDVTQTDLPGGVTSGLRQVQRILSGLEDLAFCELTSQDVVRHKLVSDIIDAYAKAEAEEAQADGAAGSGRHGYGGPRRGHYGGPR
jgi:phosphate starvation-inducible PhoH-like protein